MSTASVRGRCGRLVFLWLVGLCIATPTLGQGDPGAVPDAAEIDKLLEQQPLAAETWPVWRERFLLWYDDRSGATDDLDTQLANFVGQQFNAAEKTLPPPLADDAIAWHLLGSYFMQTEDSPDPGATLQAAESAYRRGLEIDPGFGGTHSALAYALIYQTLVARDTLSAAEKEKRLNAAEQELARAQERRPGFRPAAIQGMLAFAREQYAEAERALRQAMEDYPRSEGIASWYLQALFAAGEPDRQWSEASAPIAERFPEHGTLQALHAGALLHDGQYAEAGRALDRAEQLGVQPQQTLGTKAVEQIRKLAKLVTPEFKQAMDAMNAKQFVVAAALFEKALAADPDNVELARWLATALLSSPGPDARVAGRMDALCRSFPQDGDLQTYLAVALARDQRYAESARALRKARELGADSAELIGADTVHQIEERSRPGLVMQFLQIMGWFAAAYAVIISLMAGAGILLSAVTPRVPEPPPGAQFGGCEVFMSGHESSLARRYMLVLILGLLLFYVSVPFVIAGLVASTAAALYLIVQLPPIPVQLLVIVMLTGLGMAWAVLKSLFASHGSGSFGLRKTAEECPRLIAAIREVASRTVTTPLDEVYVAPGASIGVHQEGRGPFGMFGVKRRVLTLGLSTMSALTISELKAILAHEYAHFSHQDTYYSRFIHQVTLSIQQALAGMTGAGGRLNYLNPFFWFFWLYYHAYRMLACGFSRSREFLADRMAVSLYGKEAFISSLTKVATEGAMFEGMMFQNVDSLLAEGKAFENIYESFREYHGQNVTSEDRQKMYRALLEEKPSWFATHPTFQERLRAVTPFADLPPQEPQPANSLFEDPVAIEKELTDYLTHYVALVRQLQAQAAAGS